MNISLLDYETSPYYAKSQSSLSLSIDQSKLCINFFSDQPRGEEERCSTRMKDLKSCDQCLKTFASRESLRKHKQTHDGAKKYDCSECIKSFNQKGNLKTHSLIHTGEKPHKCTQCNYSTNQSQHLSKHILKHTGKKPHQCNQCAMLQSQCK